MGWWDEFTNLVSRSVSAYTALYEHPDIRKDVLNRAYEETVLNPRSLGDTVEGFAVILNAMATNGDPEKRLSDGYVSALGNFANLANDTFSILPGASVITSGAAAAGQIAAGRGTSRLADFGLEAATSFLPGGVGEAVGLFRQGADLPVLSQLIQPETYKPVPTLVPAPNRLPAVLPQTPRTLPRPLPEPQPLVPALPEIPTPKKEQPVLQPSFSPASASASALVSAPVPSHGYSRTQRLNDALNPVQPHPNISAELLRPAPTYRPLKKQKRKR